MITVDLRGLEQFEKRLEALGQDVATKIGQSANRAGAVELAKEVKKTAPNSPRTTEGEERRRKRKGGSVRTEQHKKIVNNVRVKKTRATDGNTVQNSVAIVGAYHANFVQFGSIHNAVNPFMLDALQNSEERLIAAVAKVLEKRVTKAGA